MAKTGSDKFYIAPYDKTSGLHNDVKSFMIPDKAFSVLNNAYVWRDRVRKRFGSRWLSNSQLETRLRINVATTAAVTGNLGATIMPGAIWAIGQSFSVGDTIFTVYQINGATLTTGSATATFDTATGTLVITGNNENPLTDVYFYPSEPVMGFDNFETDEINFELTIAFDTQFAYLFTAGWERIDAENAAGDALWTGSNSQFFWGASYGSTQPSTPTLYVTNFNEAEPNYMRYLISVTGNLTWFQFRPTISLMSSGAAFDSYLDSALILVPFKNRLVALNTWETLDDGMTATQINYRQRIRWCGPNQDPTIQATSWRIENTIGLGGSADLATSEAIITVEFVRDRLIIFCERSTWELVYTGNDLSPFVTQKINTELGAESTFSIVPFDSVAIGVGNEGVIACTGTNVQRIDSYIPNVVFEIHNTEDGPQRVHGIRDYFVEMIYWTMPDPTANTFFPFPKKVLTYNYKNSTWAFNDDSITAFGYIFKIQGITWDSQTVTWDSEESWDNTAEQVGARNVLAGNQQGWTFLVDSECPTNCPALYITDISIIGFDLVEVVCDDFNMVDGDYVYFEGIQGTGDIPLLNGTIQQIQTTIGVNGTFTFWVPDGLFPTQLGTYTGDGLIARVSKLEIYTKSFNFYQKADRNASINKIDFLIDSTAAGKILVDYFVSRNIRSMVVDSAPVTGTGVLLGTSVLETSPYLSVPFEADASQLWHSIYIMAQGEFIQLGLYFDDALMRDEGVRQARLTLYAMCFSAQSTGRLQ